MGGVIICMVLSVVFIFLCVILYYAYLNASDYTKSGKIKCAVYIALCLVSALSAIFSIIVCISKMAKLFM